MSATSSQPKGILKHVVTTSKNGPNSLAWDEANLWLNESQRDTTHPRPEPDPKTPWVSWNPETDEVMNLDRLKIPGFELGRPEEDPTESSSSTHTHSNPSSRRSSGASEKMVTVDAGLAGSDQDEEDELQDDETLEHRKKFAEVRHQHYRNEGEVMKQRAQALLDEEESSGNDVPPPLPTTSHSNSTRMNSTS